MDLNSKFSALYACHPSLYLLTWLESLQNTPLFLLLPPETLFAASCSMLIPECLVPHTIHSPFVRFSGMPISVGPTPLAGCNDSLFASLAPFLIPPQISCRYIQCHVLSKSTRYFLRLYCIFAFRLRPCKVWGIFTLTKIRELLQMSNREKIQPIAIGADL